MAVCSEGKRRKDFLEKCRSKINSLQLGFEFGGIRLLLYVKTRVFEAFQMSLDVPKGLRLSPYQRMMFWAPKTKVLEPIKMTCVHMVGACVCMDDSCVHMLLKNSNFNYSVGPNSNSHNLLNISPNQEKIVFKLKTRMSSFQ